MNMSIQCEVTECKYNDGNERYCTLSSIKVAGEGMLNNSVAGAQCASFQAKS